jgi:hypothetical protein
MGSTSIGRNRASRGAGIANYGDLTLQDASSIRRNVATGASGSGVWNEGSVAMIDHSAISGNLARPDLRAGWLSAHGGGVSNHGTLTLNGSSAIHANRLIAGACGRVSFFGGGVSNGGTITMNGASRIIGNTIVALCDGTRFRSMGGGGVSNQPEGALTMNGSSRIMGNRIVAGSRWLASSRGGGVFSEPGSRVRLNGHSAITRNLAQSGGGIYLMYSLTSDPTVLTLTGSSAIADNTAGRRGGGLDFADSSVRNGVICRRGGAANVLGNQPDDCHRHVDEYRDG